MFKQTYFYEIYNYFRLTADEAFALIDQMIDNEKREVTLYPPIESSQAETDVDSDNSDDAYEIDHLPRRILQAEAEISKPQLNEYNDEIHEQTSSGSPTLDKTVKSKPKRKKINHQVTE